MQKTLKQVFYKYTQHDLIFAFENIKNMQNQDISKNDQINNACIMPV